METKQRLWDIDEVWELYCDRANDHLRFELLDGELIEMTPPGGEQGELSLNLGSYIRAFVRGHNLGRATVETAYHPADDRQTLLGPDIAFISHDRAPYPFPKRFVPVMPNLAVEILSPSDTIRKAREKAKLYLTNGTRLVWLVLPDKQSVEVCRLTESGLPEREVFGPNDTLSGEGILPGFTLDVRRIFE